MKSTGSQGTIHIPAAALIAAVLTTICGCWEKIEYKGLNPAVAPAPPPQVSLESDGGEAVAPASLVTHEEVPSNQPEGTSNGLTADPAPATAVESPSAEATSETPPEVDPYAMSGDEPAGSSETASATDEVELASSEPETTEVAEMVDAEAPNTRRAAWTLGRGLSLAALANDRGVAAKSVPKWLEEARTAAETLGTSVNELPERPAASDGEPASRQVLNYLFVDGQRIGRDLQGRYGADHAALVELSVKSSLLILLYEPGSSTAENILEALKQAASRAGLPAELMQPLVELVTKKSTAEDVRAGVRQFHADVDRYLAAPVEP